MSGVAALGPMDAEPLSPAPLRRRDVGHRPFPRPRLPPEAFMSWRDTAFLSWRVGRTALRGLVPAGLDLDLHDGDAWVSVVAFEMRGKRMAVGVPLAARAFPELNVRTYVRRGGRPGIRFLSMDTPGRLVGFVGRRMGMPYRAARLVHGPDVVDEPPDARPLRFSWVAGKPRAPDATDVFLVERYVAFLGRRGARRLHVHHGPWPLASAKVQGFEPGFLQPLVGRRRPDHVVCSPGVDACAWLR